MTETTGGRPRTAVVVGAGIVGLSTAWFLQEHGVRVTVLDRNGVAAGASWGNAGWLSPGLAIPLNEPAVLRTGLGSLVRRDAPLHVPPTVSPGLWSFLLRFAAHCTWPAWHRVVAGNLALNNECLDGFDALIRGGVAAETVEAPITAVFESAAQTAPLLAELRRITAAGVLVDHTTLTGSEVAAHVPQLSARAGAGVQLAGQRYVDPGGFVAALADSVRERGGTIRTGFDVRSILPQRNAVTLVADNDAGASGDVAVLATGAWLSPLAKKLGVRVPVRAGRGYSFTVPTASPIRHPVYLPGIRVACTPYRDGMRVAGTMEFRGPDDPPDERRVRAIVRSAAPFFDDVDWSARTGTWVGPRPVTTDGLPLIGATTAPGVFVAGGHGMWGFTQGPVTGRLLAERIVTGKRSEALRPFDPLR
ncbi:FAD-binding oxidoreductase [Amycolatopsis sp. YIM 10]|uniref:NAD(P)/FAD-dependent oxidoreductase n=1 Tax=Amycolatopsis sp. YIM 10 TaxID=2653857 RepID=UPI0012904E7C|nr:FAD-dependent oxidoreductase [Amycolatopsis sp. YIM 10]QFU89850.1 D-amino acid dehydrogenase small subunit [Amycolatopsis sp. YIM 10]